MWIRWTTPAYNDVNDSIDYIHKESPKAAQKIANRIWQAAKHLIDHPNIGRPGRVGGTREFILADVGYIIVYRVEKDSISILRVLSVKKDWPEEM